MDARDSAGRLSDVEREYAGGVLGAVAGVALGPDDSLFVLDRQYQKIAVFGPNGSFGRLILGGEGSGPGEFEFPRAVALIGGDEIAVIDQQNGRLTRFSRAGEYISSFRTSQRDLDLESRADTIFVTQHYQRPRDSGLRLYSLAGRDAGTRIDPSGGMLDLSLHGNPGILEKTSDGTLLFASPEVGVWYESDSGPFVRRGHPLFPDLEGRIDSRQRGNRTLRVRVVPAAVQGIVRTAGGLTLIFFDVRYRSTSSRTTLLPASGWPCTMLTAASRAGACSSATPSALPTRNWLLRRVTSISRIGSPIRISGSMSSLWIPVGPSEGVVWLDERRVLWNRR